MYTNRSRNQENGNCLLQWPVSIAEEDGSDRTVVAVPGFDVIMKFTGSGRAVSFVQVSHADGCSSYDLLGYEAV
jgi:hypothetical protein